jgi:hypothetical protein
VCAEPLAPRRGLARRRRPARAQAQARVRPPVLAQARVRAAVQAQARVRAAVLAQARVRPRASVLVLVLVRASVPRPQEQRARLVALHAAGSWPRAPELAPLQHQEQPAPEMRLGLADRKLESDWSQSAEPLEPLPRPARDCQAAEEEAPRSRPQTRRYLILPPAPPSWVRRGEQQLARSPRESRLLGRQLPSQSWGPRHRRQRDSESAARLQLPGHAQRAACLGLAGRAAVSRRALAPSTPVPSHRESAQTKQYARKARPRQGARLAPAPPADANCQSVSGSAAWRWDCRRARRVRGHRGLCRPDLPRQMPAATSAIRRTGSLEPRVVVPTG